MKLWIRLDVAIRSDPNVAELAARLNLKKAEAVGLCTLVWAAIAEHRPTGDLTGVGISALEDWACWIPRKGAGAGAFGKAFLDLFVSKDDDDPTSIGASGWLDRQGKLVALAEKERTRKDEKKRGNSAESGGISLPTERNGTEQQQKPSSRVRARFPEADRPGFDDLLSRVPVESSWVAEIEAMLDGMHGPKVPPETMARAIKDFAANGKLKLPNIRQFRRYVEGATNDKPLEAPPAMKADVARLWAIVKEYGFANATRFTIDNDLARAKNDGKVTDTEAFRRTLNKLNRSALRDARSDDYAVKLIAESLAGIAPEGLAA